MIYHFYINEYNIENLYFLQILFEIILSVLKYSNVTSLINHNYINVVV